MEKTAAKFYSFDRDRWINIYNKVLNESEIKSFNEVKHHIVLGTIGSGTFGVVKMGENKDTKEKVAIKIMKLKNLIDRNNLHVLENEVRNLQKLSQFHHKHIIELREVQITIKKAYLIMEYAPRSMNQYFRSKEFCFSVDECRKYFKQIISGVDFCHSIKIVHRDLKLENLLLDFDFNVKIADFGFSATFTDTGKLHASCGTMFFASPEIISGKSYKGPEVDIWSCGIILFNLLHGSRPYYAKNNKRLLKKMKAKNLPASDRIPNDAFSLISHMLTYSPMKRATIEDIKNHAWFNKALPRGVPRSQSVSDVSLYYDGATAVKGIKIQDSNSGQYDLMVNSGQQTMKKDYANDAAYNPYPSFSEASASANYDHYHKHLPATKDDFRQNLSDDLAYGQYHEDLSGESRQSITKQAYNNTAYVPHPSFSDAPASANYDQYHKQLSAIADHLCQNLSEVAAAANYDQYHEDLSNESRQIITNQAYNNAAYVPHPSFSDAPTSASYDHGHYHKQLPGKSSQQINKNVSIKVAADGSRQNLDDIPSTAQDHVHLTIKNGHFSATKNHVAKYDEFGNIITAFPTPKKVEFGIRMVEIKKETRDINTTKRTKHGCFSFLRKHF